ncbi:amidohydrolase family protein [Brachybacterium sp. YJGR34]|uniref:amidohydrolase family protein n=1 Tax=Brachybacterium sp. YJGR34 TaxID=2059911 RepID=UPI000E0C2379|nr:amidohydrolase family protein [Brachybacterium sp. YJGR34]
MTVSRTTILASVRPWGLDSADLVIEGEAIAAVLPAGSGRPEGAEVIDGRGLLALPGLVNAHAHADKSWWGAPWVSYGGEATTQGRIAHERAERGALGIPSTASTERVLREFLRHGTTAVRSHVDVDLGVGLDGIAVLREASAALGDAVEVEVVAFPQDGVIRREGVLDLLDRAAREGAESIGGLDPCLIDRDPVAQLDGLFDIAARHGCGIDIHLHAGGDLGAFEYDLIVDRTRRAGLIGKVNIAHGFALGQLPPGRQQALLEDFAELGISWSTVAPIRSAPLPWVAMREGGVGIGLGTDGVRDLWSPYGDGDLLRVALDFARLHGVRYDEDFAQVARLATSAAAPYVHREVHDLVPGARADVVLLEAENVPDAIVRAPRRELVLAGGRVVARAGDVLV